MLMIVDRGYLDHWKTNLLRQLTGLPNAAEIPLRLWEHCESRRSDFIGDDKRGFVISGICRAPIEPKKLLKALQEARFLEEKDAGFVVHGWSEKNAAWLAKIDGGKRRAVAAARDSQGRLTSYEPATDQLAGSYQPANGQHGTSLGDIAGSTAGAVEWSGVEKSREPADTPPASRRDARGGSSLSALEDTTRFVCSGICGKKRPRLSNEADHVLSEHADMLPLSAEQKELLLWWLKLPEDEADAWLKARPKDPNKLAIRLFDELDRAEAHRLKSGAQISSKKTTAEKPEPARWQEWHGLKFPALATPQSFWHLPESIRSAFELWRSEQ